MANNTELIRRFEDNRHYALLLSVRAAIQGRSRDAMEWHSIAGCCEMQANWLIKFGPLTENTNG